jgi:23S rRNA pseudouridine2605 synthase
MQRNSRPGKGAPKSSDPRPKRSPSSTGRKSAPGSKFNNESAGESPRRSYTKSTDGERPARRSFDKSGDGERPARRSYTKSTDSDRPARRSFDKSGDGERPARRSFDKSSDGERPARRSFDKSGDGERPAHRSFDKSGESERPARRSFDKSGDGERPARRSFDKSSDGGRPAHRSFDTGADRRGGYKRKPAVKDYPGSKPGPPSPDGSIRLNKFLSNSGVSSRREADELIKAGAVMVNGVVVTELGTKVLPSDKVQYGNETIRKEKLVYVLLNKPKGYITTTDDPFDRNTVMSLVADAGRERIYPVGRLDRNTSGLLLFTNDGELATKLMHPSHKVRKIYHAELDKALTKADLIKIGEGIELEDGLVLVDEIAYAEGGKSKKEIGIELHSGRNRVVRRIFEALGYEVVKLDRMSFAGLTKKDLPRGRWRFLTEKEVSFLKMIR